MLTLAFDLEQGQFTADHRAFHGEVMHLMDGHHTLELHFDLVDHLWRA